MLSLRPAPIRSRSEFLCGALLLAALAGDYPAHADPRADYSRQIERCAAAWRSAQYEASSSYRFIVDYKKGVFSAISVTTDFPKFKGDSRIVNCKIDPQVRFNKKLYLFSGFPGAGCDDPSSSFGCTLSEERPSQGVFSAGSALFVIEGVELVRYTTTWRKGSSRVVLGTKRMLGTGKTR